MGINFDQIPDSIGFSLPPEGLYRMHVDKADMKMAYIATDPLELNLTTTLFDEKGKNCGKFFDKFKDNPQEDASKRRTQLYKIGRFVKASGLAITGEILLKDLAKLLPGVEVIIDINHYTNPKTTKTYAQANIFGGGCYYPVSEYAELLEKRKQALDNLAQVDAETIPDPTTVSSTTETQSDRSTANTRILDEILDEETVNALENFDTETSTGETTEGY